MTKSNSGTHNVLEDLGFTDAKELTAKVTLAMKINELIDDKALTQVQVADLTGMTQPKVSNIRRYKLLNISLERMMHALVALDQNVEIIVRPARQNLSPDITVTI